MIEKRKHSRVRPAGAVIVYDASTDHVLGTLGNVSTEGLMVITTEPLKEDRILKLRFLLTDDDVEHEIVGEAETLWCAPANQPGRYWVGLQLVQISEYDREYLQQLTREGA